MRSLPLLAVATSVAAAIALPGAGVARAATLVPAWLALRPGTIARVDIAPWLVSDEPEAALTQSPGSLARNFSDDATRPGDVLYQPIGVRVRILRLTDGGRIALVHGIGARFSGYAPLARLVPEIPAGTALVVAGGFEGFADFYSTLGTPEKRAVPIATGSRLAALEIGAAPYDPDSADLVRVRVRVLDGNLRGRTGWVSVAYTGIPADRLPATAQVAEKACRCRLVQFIWGPSGARRPDFNGGHRGARRPDFNLAAAVSVRTNFRR